MQDQRFIKGKFWKKFIQDLKQKKIRSNPQKYMNNQNYNLIQNNNFNMVNNNNFMGAKQNIPIQKNNFFQQQGNPNQVQQNNQQLRQIYQYNDLEIDQEQKEQNENSLQLFKSKKLKGIMVYIRLKPLNIYQGGHLNGDGNFNQNMQSNLSIMEQNTIIQIQNQNQQNNQPDKQFKFDYIFDDKVTQEFVFKVSSEIYIQKLFDGFNCAMLVYGQSGSGKTHTMLGAGFDNMEKIKQGNIDVEQQGLIPRLMNSLFKKIHNDDNCNIEYDLRASYIEIYQESIKDLLYPSQRKIRIYQEKDFGLIISDATQVGIETNEDVLQLIQNGSKARKMGKTNYNEHSSRSHALVIITLFMKDKVKGDQKAAQLYMVDLAGSENVGRANRDGYGEQQQREAGSINQSLLALGQVIAALTEENGQRKHVPYRDSKLTRLLENAFGGNSYTSLILNVSQDPKNYYDTLGTLNLGARANNISNNPTKNSQMDVKILQKMYEKIKLDYQKYQIRTQKIIRELIQYVNPEIEKMIMEKYQQDLGFLLTIEQKRNSGFLKLKGNPFAYVFTFLTPKEIVPLFIVSREFYDRLRSEYLWKLQLDNLKLKNPAYNYEEQKIQGYYLFYKKTALQRYMMLKQNQIQSSKYTQQNIRLFKND